MIHNIRFRLFIYKDELEEDLIIALNNILPDADYDVEIAEGIMEEPIQIITGKVDKKRKCKDFLNNLMQIDRKQLLKLKDDLNRKMDDNGNLFLRFDKEDALNEIWTIKDKGDSIHLKIKIAAYPAKKEIALKLLNGYIDDYLSE